MNSDCELIMLLNMNDLHLWSMLTDLWRRQAIPNTSNAQQ